jgi:hypothetical protein
LESLGIFPSPGNDFVDGGRADGPRPRACAPQDGLGLLASADAVESDGAMIGIELDDQFLPLLKIHFSADGSGNDDLPAAADTGSARHLVQ